MFSNAIPLLASLMRLWDATYDRVRELPKFDKHLIGRMLLDDLDACTLEILLACNAYEHRSAHLMQASAHFDAAKIRIRIMVRRELLTERWYASQLDTLADIGKQIGGWRRRATPPPDTLERIPHPFGCGMSLPQASPGGAETTVRIREPGSIPVQVQLVGIPVHVHAGMIREPLHPLAHPMDHSARMRNVLPCAGQRVSAPSRRAGRPSW